MTKDERRVDDSYSKINNVCLVILASVAVTIALIYTRAIMIPFVFALFAYAIVSPVVRWFRLKWKLHKAISVALTIFLFLLFSSFILYFISVSLHNFFESADVYKQQILEFVAWAGTVVKKWGINFDDATIINRIKELPIFKLVTNLGGSVASFIGNTTLVILFVIFLIAGEGAGQMTNPLLIKIHRNITGYASRKFLTSLATGTIVGIVLAIVGVKLAFMFGVLAFLLNFIPNFGSIIAIFLPLPVVLLQFGFGWQFVVSLALPALTQFSIGNIIEPKIMGDGLDLHPVTILVFLMFWGLVWGLPGMFLAVPITAIMKIIFNRIPTTKGLAEIFAGRIPS